MIKYYQPSKVNFGAGGLEGLGGVVEKYGHKCLLVTTPKVAPLDRLYENVIELLEKKGIQVIHFDKVMPNPTVEMVNDGFEIAKKNKIDVVLAVGGGSSIDTAKILALTYGLEKIDWDGMFEKYTNPFEDYEPLTDKKIPLIAVSTTSGTGSQVTQAAVISRGKEKNTIFHPNCFSTECIVDPTLMKTLPKKLTAATGFDAFTHAFESYINDRASEFTEIMAEKAMRIIVEYLPKTLECGDNIEYRSKLAIADTLAGSSLANSGAAAPHPLSEIIGGITHISHGEALAIVFPKFTEICVEKNEEKFARVARIFNTKLNEESDKIAAKRLHEEIKKFLDTIELKTNMRAFNVSELELEEIINNPILGFLPFESKEILIQILKESY